MNRSVSKELVFDSLVECKKRMDKHSFLSTYFTMDYSFWGKMRVFLIDKKIIKSRHNTYVWIGEEPSQDLALEFFEHYKSLKKTDKKTIKKSKHKDSATMYEDLVALQKKVQKLKEENREMFKELKENYLEKVRLQKAYDELSQRIKSVLYNPEEDSVLYDFLKNAIINYKKQKP